MKKPIFILLLFSLSFSAFSQVSIMRGLDSFTNNYNFGKTGDNTLEGTSFNSIEGSAYLDKEFTPGTVTLNDSIQFQEIPLRYNVYYDKMEFMTPENIILVVDNSQADYTFEIEDNTFVNKNYNYSNENQEGILELLVNGEFKLYKKYRIEFRRATEPVGFETPKPDRFERENEEYFISVGDEKPELVNRRKDLINILKSEKPEIKKYIKSERISPRKEEDLTKLIRHCNQ